MLATNRLIKQQNPAMGALIETLERTGASVEAKLKVVEKKSAAEIKLRASQKLLADTNKHSPPPRKGRSGVICQLSRTLTPFRIPWNHVESSTSSHRHKSKPLHAAVPLTLLHALAPPTNSQIFGAYFLNVS